MTKPFWRCIIEDVHYGSDTSLQGQSQMKIKKIISIASGLILAGSLASCSVSTPVTQADVYCEYTADQIVDDTLSLDPDAIIQKIISKSEIEYLLSELEYPYDFDIAASIQIHSSRIIDQEWFAVFDENDCFQLGIYTPFGTYKNLVPGV